MDAEGRLRQPLAEGKGVILKSALAAITGGGIYIDDTINPEVGDSEMKAP